MSLTPNLEQLTVVKWEWNDELFEQEGDAMRRRHCIDGYLFPMLTSLRMESCNKIRVLLSPSSLSSLECLESLDVAYCENMEEIIMSQEESEWREKKITLPRLQYLVLRNLPNLTAFSQGSYLFDFPSLREMMIQDCANMEVLSRGPFHTPMLQLFQMTGLHGSNYIHNKVISFKEIHMFQKVRKLLIERCDSFVEVFESSERGMVAMKGFTTIHYEMEAMELENLPELRDIWGPNIMRHVSFNKLASVTIAKCDSLKSVLSQSMARSLVHLEELNVYDCDMMENIVTMEDQFMGNAGSKDETIFPKLAILRLAGLRKLECICSRCYYGYDISLSDGKEEDKGIEYDRHVVQISFPQLDKLILVSLPMLKCFCPGGAYDYDPMRLSSYCGEDYTQATTFPKGNVTVITPNLHEVESSYGTFLTKEDVNLTVHCIHNSDKYKAELQKVNVHQYQHLLEYITRIPRLELKGCDKLLSCVPCNTMHSFQHLEVLSVQECECLKEIFESSDYDQGMELYQMELHNLPKLEHIWRNVGSTPCFQKLKHLTIRECHNLKFVFPDVSIFVKSLQNLRTIQVYECDNMEEIFHSNNKSEQKGANIIFPSLHRIVLKKLPKLNCFCPSPSSFHFELPQCKHIIIEECPNMETFCYGTLYTPELYSL